MAEPVQLTPDQQQALQAFAAKYPDFDYGEGFAGIKKNPAAAADFLQLWHTLGLNDREANDRAHFNKAGQVVPDRAFWKQALLMAGVAAAPAVAYGALPAGAAGAGAGGAGGAGTAATTAAAGAGGGSLLHSLLPSIIGAGASLGGTAIASHANTEAAKLQAEQADKALALQKEQYALQRQDTAPYRALGQGAVGNLGFLSGINVDERVPELSSTVPKTPYGVTAAQGVAAPQAQASLSTLGQPSGGGFTPMRAPNGMVLQIPNDKVAEAQSKGAVHA